MSRTQTAAAGSVVPTHPSNRSFIAALRQWGVEIDESGGEKWRAKMPSGEALVVFAPTYHDGNPGAVFAEAYRQLGVSADQFWAGPVDEKPTVVEDDAAKPTPKKRERYINRVLDCLVQFAVPMSLQRMAEELSLTTAQVGSAARSLLQQEAVEQIKPGVYVAKQYAADARLAIDITGPTQVEVPMTPMAAPTPIRPPVLLDMRPTPVEDSVEVDDGDVDVDELIELMLDLMFPSGMNIKAADLKVIADWTESTKLLLRRVRAVQS